LNPKTIDILAANMEGFEFFAIGANTKVFS
jgi:hypothetical protein